ncbi:MAG: flagellar biosynthetic protein FliR [Candidatus Acidiferrales bacterium]|jgi:flagellar biosynthetic protein FliR
MSPLLEHILAHALPIAVRLAGVMTFAPFFGSDAFPARVKAALVCALTALLYGVCPTPDLSLTLLSVTRLVLREAVLGLMMGLSVQIVLEGAQLAGQLAGAQLGFSLAAIIDPQTNIETPVLTIFYQMVALLIFLQLNVHHWILRAVVKSFGYFPVGTGVVTLGAARELLRAAGAMWLIGVQIAAPVLLATLVIDVTIGFLSKASPQLPAMLLGISAKSLAGYVLLAVSVGLWPLLLEHKFLNALGWMERVLGVAR